MESSSDSPDFQFRIPMDDDENDLNNALPDLPESLIESYRRDGFAVFSNVASQSAVDALNDRLEGEPSAERAINGCGVQ